MRGKQFFAFSAPIETFFKIPGEFGLYWLDLKSVYYGCNDYFASATGVTASNVRGKTDYDFSTNKSQIKLLIENDQEIINNNITKVFVETLDFNALQETILVASLRTPLFDSKNHLAGVFGISLALNNQNLMRLLNILNEKHVKNLLHKSIKTDTISKKLTPSELECLGHLLTGKNAKETGKLLSRSQRTVEWHLKNIKHKFGCRTNPELIYKIICEELKWPYGLGLL